MASAMRNERGYCLARWKDAGIGAPGAPASVLQGPEAPPPRTPLGLRRGILPSRQQGLEISDRGYVIEHGQLVKEGAASQLISDPSIREAYLGL